MSVNTANQELFLWCLRRRSMSSQWCNEQSWRREEPGTAIKRQGGTHDLTLMGYVQLIIKRLLAVKFCLTTVQEQQVL